MARRPLSSIKAVNPVPAEKFEDWALGTDGRAVLEKILGLVADPEQDLAPARGVEEVPPLTQPPHPTVSARGEDGAEKRRLQRPNSTRTRRLVSLGAAVVIVLVALGFGVNALVQHWGHDQSVVVITDDPMQPGSEAPATPTVELPPGISRVVGQTEHSIWCLSAKDGLRSVEVGAAGPGPVGGSATRVTVGRQGRRVAYVLRQEGEVFLWDTTKQGDDAVTELEVGDPSHLVDIFMSPDETKLLVMRLEITDPSMEGGIRHNYLVDLDTGNARAWHWSEDEQVPGEVIKVLWSPSSDALYASFGPAGGSQGTTTRRYDLATGDWEALDGIAAVRDVNAQGEVVGLTEGPAIMHEGMGASDVGSLPVAIRSQGSTETLPHMSGFVHWDGAWVSADGNSIVVLGRTAAAGEGVGALEVIRRGYGGWAADRVLTGSRKIGNGLGFLGGDRFYFASGWPSEDGEAFLGYLDPVSGDYLVYEALPVPAGSRILSASLAQESGDSSGLTAPPATIRETGDTTTSTTPPASVPALTSGITPEQVLELVADRSHVAPEHWELRTHETFGDWAVANLYTSKLSEQMDERGVTAVFEKRAGAWFQAGWVSVSDPSEQEIELANMGAPEEVWSHFGLERKAAAQLFPPLQMPEDFGFVAAFGPYGRNVIDTFQGTFTKDLGLQEEPVTARLTLSPEALAALYRDLVLMEGQWQVFTKGFDPDPDPGNTGTTTYTYTYSTYHLEWRAEGFTSLPVVWEDSARSTDSEAVALREWFATLRALVEATPEWKALPPMTGGYE